MALQERDQKVTPRFWDPIQKDWRPVRDASAPNEKVVRSVWALTVEAVQERGPYARRVRFRGDSLKHLRHEPGSDLTLQLPDGEETARRHYTARSFDPEAGLLDIDFALHGDGPAVRWARSVQPGAAIEVTGPVARFDIDPSADWHLFAGDDSALPAIFGMIESLPPTSKPLVYLEVEDGAGEEALECAAPVEAVWLHRGATPGDQSELLKEAVLARPLPPGRGQVFLAGETGRMRQLRQAMVATGLEKEQIFAMGYWRPGRIGGDETIRD